ncbi:bcl2-associated agonist of cell death [Sylvia borin]
MPPGCSVWTRPPRSAAPLPPRPGGAPPPPASPGPPPQRRGPACARSWARCRCRCRCRGVPRGPSPPRGRSRSAPPVLWAAQRYGRRLRRMSDEFQLQVLPRPRSVGGAAPGGGGWREVLRAWWGSRRPRPPAPAPPP